MTDLQAIADRVEVEALRGEFTDAAMMRDRVASLFTPDGVLRMPTFPSNWPASRRSAPGASGCKTSGSSSCRTRTRARSGWTATSRPAAPTCKNSPAPATGTASGVDRGDGIGHMVQVHEITELD